MDKVGWNRGGKKKKKPKTHKPFSLVGRQHKGQHSKEKLRKKKFRIKGPHTEGGWWGGGGFSWPTLAAKKDGKKGTERRGGK